MFAKVFLISMCLILITNHAFNADALPAALMKAKCPALPEIRNVTLEQITGEWFEVQRIFVVDLLPTSLVKVSDKCSGLNMYEAKTDANEIPFDLTYFSSHRPISDTDRFNYSFTIIQGKDSGFSLQSTVETGYYGSSFLRILEVVSDKYMVLEHCVGRDDEEYMFFFAIFARKSMNEPSISQQDVAQLSDNILQESGIKSFVTLYFKEDCFN